MMLIRLSHPLNRQLASPKFWRHQTHYLKTALPCWNMTVQHWLVLIVYKRLCWCQGTVFKANEGLIKLTLRFLILFTLGEGQIPPPLMVFCFFLTNFPPQHMMKLYVNSYFVLTKTLKIYFGQKNCLGGM